MEVASSDRTYKILVLGDLGIGKTSLVLQFTEGPRCIDREHRPTIGVDYASKTLVVDDNVVTLQIWDTAGQEAFAAIVRSFYRRADAVLLMYALTHRATFEKLSHWVDEVWQYSGTSTPLFLVGNKVDRVEQREVQTGEALKFVQERGVLGFFETSAKTAETVEEVRDIPGLHQDC